MKTLFKPLLLACLICSSAAMAQTGTPEPSGLVSQETRNAGTAKAGTDNLNSLYSVDNFTGTASVHIPVYSYSINGADLSVSLGYNAGGIRVDERASTVGLGWSLNAGGYITRQVNSMEDELVLSQGNNTPAFTGAWLRDFAALGDVREQEHDLFTAVFGGRTVRFDIADGPNGDWIVKTYPKEANVTITPAVERRCTSCPSPEGALGVALPRNIHLDSSSYILKFYVRDELGNVYTFQRGDYEFKKGKDPDGHDITYYPPVKWNLTKVTTSTGLVVNYFYNEKEVTYHAYRRQETRDITTDITWQDSTEYAGSKIMLDEVVQWRGKESYLDHIDYADGVTVQFTYDNKYDGCGYMATTPLSNISITGKYDNSVKNTVTYNLKHSFFHAPIGSFTFTEAGDVGCSALYALFNATGVSDTTKKEQMANGLRLRLDEITKTGSDQVTEERAYAFSYNQTPLPVRLNESKDFYGYYNGKIPAQPANGVNFTTRWNHLSMPYHAGQSGFSYGMDKSPDITYAQACVLTKIKNGLGGTLELKYKDHVLSNPANGYVGDYTGTMPTITYPAYEGENANDGLCIDEVIADDGYNKDNTVKTKYIFSDGQRVFRGGFFWFYHDVPGAISPRGKTYTSSYVTPMQFFNGANHGYSYAEVKNYGYNNQLLGSTKYHFTNLILSDNANKSNLSVSTDLKHNTNPVNYFYEYRMGKPLDVTSYDQNGNPLQKSEYTYTDYLSGNVPDVTGNLTYGSNKNHIASPRYQQFYNFYSIPYRMTSKTDISYTNTGNFSKTVSYTYTDREDLKTVTWTDDQLRLNTKKLTYCYEANPSNWGNYAVTSKTELSRNVGGTEKFVDVTTQEFDLNAMANNNLFLVTGSKRLMNNGMEVAANVSGLMEQVTEVKAIDAKTNVLELKHNNKERYTSAIWDTRLGKQIAAVSNAKFKDIAYSSFEGSYAAMGTADDNKGNWDFDNSHIQYASPAAGLQPVTGHYYYNLAGSGVVSKNSLEAGKKYILTFWATSAPAITLGNTNHLPGPLNGFAITPVQQQQAGAWKFYSCVFNGDGSPLTIAPNGSGELDELRLYPVEAAMTTTTYEPLWGPNSQCDERGNIRYFEYDAFGRQTITRDINRNVLSVTKQVVQGADN